MRTVKRIVAIVTLAFIPFSPVLAQMGHHPPPMTPPAAQPPAAPPPAAPPPALPPAALPPAPVPLPPVPINLPPPGDPVDEPPTVTELTARRDKMGEDYKKLGETQMIPLSQKLCGKDYCMPMESAKGAEIYVGVYKNTIARNEKEIEMIQDKLDALPEDSPLREGYEKWMAGCIMNIEEAQGHLSFWEVELDRRIELQGKLDTVMAQMTALNEQMQSTQKDINKTVAANNKKASDAAAAAAKSDIVEFDKLETKPLSTTDIAADDFFSGGDTGLSAETADITPQKSLQELREDSLRDAFSELDSLEFQTGFLEKADMAGQVTQTIVGFVPAAKGADVALASARGFAEALGEEMAKGTSWGDALKIASINAGFKGTVSFVGNKLTAGADGLANRVAVLTEVGMSKLTTKQLAEYGAKGITFVVVKSGQALGQELTEEFAGKPAMKEVADWVKDDSNAGKSTASKPPSGSGYGGGFGTSGATQPFVAY